MPMGAAAGVGGIGTPGPPAFQLLNGSRLRDRQVPASGVARRLIRLRSAQAPPITRRRIAFAAELFQRLGFPRADANRRALLAYSTYLGYAQLVHATPQLLPQTQTARRAYLNDALASLTSQPSPR
jgi:hypothetical protein